MSNSRVWARRFLFCGVILSLAWVSGASANGVTGRCCFPNGDCGEFSEVFCGTLNGTYEGDGTTCSPGDCPCTADTDGSGNIDFNDLLNVLTNWGPCPGCPADLDGDGVVGTTDLIIVFASWGPCL